MPKFAANLMMVFAEQPGLDRSGAPKATGSQGDRYVVTHDFGRPQFAARLKQAVRITDQVCSGNIKLQYDIYHMRIMEGDLARTMERHLHHIACSSRTIQVAMSRKPGQSTTPFYSDLRLPCLRRDDRTRVHAEDREGGRAQLVRPI